MGKERVPRHPDWPLRLARYLQSRQNTPFEWATNDCCTFVADAVLVMTGKDAMQPLRGRYATERGAARLIKDAGGLQALVCRYLGMPMERPSMAGRGDVVLVPNTERGPGLAICIGAEVAVAGEHGTVLYPMSVALAAWKV